MNSKIKSDKEKIVVVNDNYEQEILWSDIYSISCYKLDCITKVQSFITLDLEFGEYVELHEEMIGWSEFINNIQSCLKVKDNDWKIKLEKSSPDDNVIIIYERKFLNTNNRNH